MTPYRRLTFVLINALVLAWLFKVQLWDEGDGAGLFIVVMVAFLLLYAGYYVALAHYYRQPAPEGLLDKGMFLLLALLPFVALWYCTA
jgi:hypothetical protein